MRPLHLSGVGKLNILTFFGFSQMEPSFVWTWLFNAQQSDNKKVNFSRSTSNKYDCNSVGPLSLEITTFMFVFNIECHYPIADKKTYHLDHRKVTRLWSLNNAMVRDACYVSEITKANKRISSVFPTRHQHSSAWETWEWPSNENYINWSWYYRLFTGNFFNYII